MEEEIWKDVLGYEGIYKVSNMGRIKRNNGRIKTQSKNIKNGYLSVNLSNGGINIDY